MIGYSCCGPCRIGEKRLYQPQLMVLIRSRIESGPLGTRSFLLPERASGLFPGPAPGKATADQAREAPRTSVKVRPNRMHLDRSKAKLDPGYDLSDDRCRRHRSASRTTPGGRAGRGRAGVG